MSQRRADYRSTDPANGISDSLVSGPYVTIRLNSTTGPQFAEGSINSGGGASSGSHCDSTQITIFNDAGNSQIARSTERKGLLWPEARGCYRQPAEGDTAQVTVKDSCTTIALCVILIPNTSGTFLRPSRCCVFASCGTLRGRSYETDGERSGHSRNVAHSGANL